MAVSLEGKSALVTGASRGIGRATARRLARDGAYVLVHYGVARDAAEQAVAEIKEAGGSASVVSGDLRQPAAIQSLVKEVDSELAGRSLDILVNCAGVGGGGSISQVREEDFDRLFATNVKGLFLLTQQLLDRIANGGRIINISSMVSLAAYPGAIAYAMSKAAVNSFTRSLAFELGPRQIAVNAVAPGVTDTDFIAHLLSQPGADERYRAASVFNRIGEVDDVANVVAFLANAESGWITGQVIEASGGMHLR